MKKTFGAYAVGWLAALGIFNVITFVTPNEIDGVSKFDTLFWIAYAFITLAFIGQLACAYFMFRGDSLQKTFYHIPLFRIGTAALVVMLVVGVLCMAVVQIPDWLGIILCTVALAVNVIAIANSEVVVVAVSDVDKKIKTKTMFIKMLTADAEALVARVEDEQLRGTAVRVYEAIRYSDPMSDEALAVVENQMSDKFAMFAGAVSAGDAAAAQAIAKELLALVSERNTKCKILK